MSNFFPQRPAANPTIYAYKLNGVATHDGLLKVGYTTRDARERIAEQLTTARLNFTMEFERSAMRDDGTSFTDREVHAYLRRKKFVNPEGEWFRCTKKDVEAAILAIAARKDFDIERSANFNMRPEQEGAVEKTAAYFEISEQGGQNVPHFLWNAKMRFGKTFTTYQLAKKMGWKKVLVLTFKPAVHNSWHEDLMEHVDFIDWQFVSKDKATKNPEDIEEEKPFVCFGSFQDFLGKNEAGGIKAKNEWVHKTKWDCVVLDEYHFGAWRDTARDLITGAVEKETGELEDEERSGLEYYDEKAMPIRTGAYLYLSGTPFRALATGEFTEEQIYNWTYSDEQRAKANWDASKGPNPYASLPRMVMLTYRLPDSIAEVAMKGEFNQFDLSTFFKAEGEGKNAKFIHEEEVQDWLDLLRGSFDETTVDDLKVGKGKPPLPFTSGEIDLRNILLHTFWFLPDVASCHAMANMLKKRGNTFYHEYEVIVAAGSEAGTGKAALDKVLERIGDPLKKKSITLSCGKLTTGVSVPPWTGIFMLRNMASPETYFQAAFRVQTPWVVRNEDGQSPNDITIYKENCYVFDFAPNRALQQIVTYTSRSVAHGNAQNTEQAVAEFIHFLPVLSYNGSAMVQIDAGGVLDLAMTGTSAKLLARGWKSALLVNVDNETLGRLLADERALQALDNIEDFRSLNLKQDIEIIINKSEAIQKIKNEANNRKLSVNEKQQLNADQKEYRVRRDEVQKQLIKLAARIPVFMYLSDKREYSVRDVITKLEPGLFKKVTGLDVGDFEHLVSLNLFNSSRMNISVLDFKRFEDASLSYTGINRHEGEDIGLYDTVISAKEYRETFENNP